MNKRIVDVFLAVAKTVGQGGYMLKMVLRGFVMSVLFGGFAGVLFAEGPVIQDTHTSFGPRLTFSQPKDADASSLSVGAQIRLNLMPSLKLEGSIDYRRNDYGRLTRVHVYPIQASALIYFTPQARISPYLLGGVGMYYTQVEVPLIDFNYTTNRFGLHGGAGIEVMLNDTLSVDGSYRQIWVEKFTSREAGVTDKEYDDSGSMITVALNFLF